METILARLPPCRLPDAFNYETFLANTEATEAEIIQFVTWTKTQERNRIGFGPPSEKAVAEAVAFFKTLNSRGDWVAEAKKFYRFRQEQKGDIHETMDT